MAERRRKQVRRRKPKIKFNKSLFRNLTVIYFLIVGFLVVLCIKIAYINVTSGDEFSIAVLSQQSFTNRVVPYKRGDIKDRNGNVLATSVMTYNIVIDSKLLKDDESKNDRYMGPTVEMLCKFFGFSESKLKEEIEKRKDSNYWVAKKDIPYKEVKAFDDYINADYDDDEMQKKVDNVKGVWFEKEYNRMYPYNDLACSVLGYSNKNNYATLGIENSYSKYLNGTEGREYGYIDADNNLETVVRSAEDGDTVISSIDMNIQRIVQKAIKKYMAKYEPQRIACVISDPNTGEILAMADDTTFNLNNPTSLRKYYTKEQEEKMNDKKKAEKLNAIWKNFCITDTYEPGSTAKPFTVSVGLEEGVISKNESFYCSGSKHVDVFNISCHKEDGHGQIDVRNAVAQSCNVAMMDIASKIGADKFKQYQARFNFGNRTGIDLPDEMSGLVYGEDRVMGLATLATNSFGQNFNVTMVQMIAGFSSLINGGNYYEPRVVKQIVTNSGDLVKNYSKTLVKQTITKDTSDFVKKCLREVVLTGTGKTAAIDGYTVGGKTGTAEKVYTNGKTGRIKGQHILSFIGCVPCENPQVVCYTVMDSPKGNSEATIYNTELWAYIMKQVLPYMGIQKTYNGHN